MRKSNQTGALAVEGIDPVDARRVVSTRATGTFVDLKQAAVVIIRQTAATYAVVVM